MHSRMFQIEDHPVLEDERMNSADFEEHWFTREIADYVTDVPYRDDDVYYFIDGVLLPLGEYVDLFRENGQPVFILHKGFRERYFAKTYERFCVALDKLSSEITLDSFASNQIHSDLYTLRTLYDDRHGIWLYYDHEIFTLDQWMRSAVEGEKYYFGGVLDYHF